MNKARNFLMQRPLFFRWVFAVSWLFTLCLFLGSFFCPPMGLIDASVLKAASLLLCFCSVAMIPDIIASGKAATIEHGDTKVTFNSDAE